MVCKRLENILFLGWRQILCHSTCFCAFSQKDLTNFGIEFNTFAWQGTSIAVNRCDHREEKRIDGKREESRNAMQPLYQVSGTIPCALVNAWIFFSPTFQLVGQIPVVDKLFDLLR